MRAGSLWGALKMSWNQAKVAVEQHHERAKSLEVFKFKANFILYKLYLDFKKNICFGNLHLGKSGETSSVEWEELCPVQGTIQS